MIENAHRSRICRHQRESRRRVDASAWAHPGRHAESSRTHEERVDGVERLCQAQLEQVQLARLCAPQDEAKSASAREHGADGRGRRRTKTKASQTSTCLPFALGSQPRARQPSAVTLPLTSSMGRLGRTRSSGVGWRTSFSSRANAAGGLTTGDRKRDSGRGRRMVMWMDGRKSRIAGEGGQSGRWRGGSAPCRAAGGGSARSTH